MLFRSVSQSRYFPVYYGIHLFTDYSLVITYQFNSSTVLQSTIESAFSALLIALESPSTHSDTVKATDIFSVLADADLDSSVAVLGVVIKDVDGNTVPYLTVPKTRLAQLTAYSYTAIDVASTS